ncbi:MAG: phosphodiester glycosidase family protein, partial [Solobacterium sp.]|nr:phosphodiester glycosidase family protein [Solobacterium sp.]
EDQSENDGGNETGETVITESSYQDDNIQITLKEYETNDTTVYVADIQLSDASYLQTALAQGLYGKNVTAETSETAESVGAILAINGDYYGSQERGYVLRNGVLYRSSAESGQEDLVIYEDGSFEIINESDVSAEELLANGAVQILSFGPALIENSSIAVSEDEEVGKAKASNPRTAIAEIEPLHYLFVVSDGRSDYSEGLSLYELAAFLKEQGAVTAYNLDGGGSSTMIFNGELVNYPTTSGRTIKERSVSDAVVIGY